MQNLSLFIFTSLLLALTPGQDFIYIMVRSISQGVRAGYIAIAGLLVGVMFHTFAAATGVAAILLTSSYAFIIIKIIGAIYLIYLGIESFRQKGTLEIKKTDHVVSDLKLLKDGMLSSTLNPKLALFFMAFLSQFVRHDSNAFYNMLLLGLLFILVSIPILFSVALFSAKFGNILIKNKTISNSIGKISGVILIGLGINLVFADR